MSSPSAGPQSHPPTSVVPNSDNPPSNTLATLHGDDPAGNVTSFIITQLDDFRIVREIGRGGMGVVYEAIQESLGRRVALKMLNMAGLNNETQRRRFLREAQAAARMHHTNIVPVFRVGEADGMPYYAMQYIDGQGLDSILRPPEGQESTFPMPRNAEGFTALARIGLQAAEALDHAHSHGLVHRDIKPANLLLDRTGNLWITDFGLARTAEDEDLTQEGHLVGTMRYLAPERFRGQCDPRSDLYALGLTLYELATRRVAFDSHDQTELMRLILEAEPPRVRRVNSAVPRDLETIIIKAMASRLEDRYASARDMADDLRAFLEGKPIKARRRSLAERFVRWARRNPVVAGLTILSFTLAIVAAGVGFTGYVQTREALKGQTHERERAETALEGQTHERERAEKTLDLAIDALDHVFMRLGGGDPLAKEESATLVLSEQTAALLQELMGFYKQFAERNADNERLRADIARANQRIGDIQMRLGQLDKAEQSHRTALAQYQTLAKEQPNNSEWIEHQAQLQADIGFELHLLGRNQDAEQPLTEAAKLYQRLRQLNPKSSAYRYGLAMAFYRLASVNRHPRAIRTGQLQVREARTILEELQNQDKNNGRYRVSLARAQRLLGAIDHMLGDGDPGKDYEEALAILEKLVADQPQVPDYQAELIETYLAVPVDVPDIPREVTQLRTERALELARALNREYSSVPNYELLLGRALTRQGEVYSRDREPVKSERILVEANQRLEKLVKRHPKVTTFLLPLADARLALARTLTDLRQLEEARATLEDGIERTNLYISNTPHSIPALESLLRQYRMLGDVLRRQGLDNEAEKAMKEAMKVEERLRPPEP